MNLWDRVYLNQPTLPPPNDLNPLASIASRRPFPAFGDVLQASFRDFSYYHALQTRAELRPASSFTVQISYVFAKSIDTASGGTATTGHMDRTNLNREKALSNFDVRNALSLMYSYDLPLHNRRRLLNAVLAGWQTNGILTYYSGQPFSATLSADVAATGPGTQRADVLLDPNLPSAQRTTSRWFNTAVFRIPRTGTFGNSGRNIIQGLPTLSLDASLFKNLQVRESCRLQIRLESFNALNHPNYTDLNTTAGSPGFGAVTSAGPARQVQFAMKLLF
jgi:hypothetical protein